MKFNEVFEAFLAGKGIAYKYPVGQYEVYRLYKSKTLTQTRNGLRKTHGCTTRMRKGERKKNEQS